MSEELLDVIDDNDKALRVESYETVHKNHLRHRVAHVFLKHKDGKLLLQKRSAFVKAFPLYWTFSAGGHVRSGESFEEAIRREAEEELRITLRTITLAEEGLYDGPDNHFVYYKTFLSEYDGSEIRPNEDVDEVKFIDMKDIEKMKDQEKFHPIFLYTLEKYLKEKV